MLIHVVYAVLFLNTLPLLGIVFAAIVTSGFARTESWTISFAYQLSAGVLDYLKLLLGTIVVPGITAFAIQKLDPTVKLPREARILLGIFFLLVVAGAIVGSLHPTFMAQGLKHTLESTEQQMKFQEVPWNTAKESLTYACLLLGIRASKG